MQGAEEMDKRGGVCTPGPSRGTLQVILSVEERATPTKNSLGRDELCGQMLAIVRQPLSPFLPRLRVPVGRWPEVNSRFRRSSNVAPGYNEYAASYVMKFIAQAW
jgi:hypothetical protein